MLIKDNEMTLPKKDVLVLCMCIAFAILALGAAGNKGRHHAQMILCQTNLAKMAQGTQMYANDNEGRLFNYNYGAGLWTGPLAVYADKDEVRYMGR